MVRPVWAEVDLQAIRDNLRAISGTLKRDTVLMAVVKANAYGHGLVPVARVAVEAGAERLGVALVEEAIELRQAGLDVPIQILSEAPAVAADRIVELGIIPTVYSLAAAQAISRAADGRDEAIDVHIKVDTGMHRVGVAPRQVVELYQAVKELPGIRVEGMLTHFACADDPENDYTEKQLAVFLRLRETLPEIPIWHAANSAAALFMPETHLDMVRIGLAMYGLQPSSLPSPVLLNPALSLKAGIGFTQDLAPGEGASYGLTFIAAKPMRVGTLPIGYGDGFSRLLSNRGSAIINGRRVPLIGNICMDQLLVELPAGASVGDEAVLIGRQGDETISAEEIAALLGTINYEIVCMINNRVPRRYLHAVDS
jgi:alanine racemase